MKNDFIERIANTDVGRELNQYLKDLEVYYADIRNLKGTSAEARIDALRILREALIDKLALFNGEIDPPEQNEFL